MLNPITAYMQFVTPHEENSDPQEAMREKAVAFFTLFGLLAGLYSGIKWYKHGLWEVAAGALLLILGSLACMAMVKLRAAPSLVIANMSLASMTSFIFILIYQLGAIESTHILWVIGVVIFAYLLTDSRSAKFWSAVSLVFLFLLIWGDRNGYTFPQHELGAHQEMINQYSGFLLPMALLWLAQAYSMQVRAEAMQKAHSSLIEAKKLSEQSAEMSRNLSQVLGQAGSNSETLLEASNQLNKIVDIMQQRSQSICTSVEEQAVASVQITDTLTSMANEVEHSSSVMTEIRDRTLASEQNVSHSAQAMTQAKQNMARVKDSNEGIFSAMSVIRDIADQTNLLALNAAIESARAGEHGRGFAVVADEVRSLSIKSNESAEEIRQLLDTAGNDVVKGSTAVNQAGELLAEVEHSAQEVTQQVSRIAEVMQEQSSDIVNIVNASENVKRISQDNAEFGRALSEESEALAEIAQQLSGMARAMHALVNEK